MKRLVLFCVLGLATSSVVAEEPQLSAEQVSKIVGDLRLETRTLGMLAFCEQQGLRRAVEEKLMGNLMKRISLEGGVPSQSESLRVFRAAELYALGVASGLNLSLMEESKEAQFCLLAGKAADSVLTGTTPEGGP